jgi:uncharacterized protein (TIGR02147 family)
MATKNPTDALSVFNFESSLPYLKKKVDGQGHGFKSAVAKASGCQSAYVSRVLNGLAFFSLEQAEKVSQLFLHTEAENHYFLTLVQKDRAGTPELRAYFEKQLHSLREERLNLKERIQVTSEITEQDRHIYYSSWIYSAVYVMTSVPKYQDIQSLSKALQVTPQKVLAALDFLTSIGLVRQDQGKFKIASGSIHLGKDSPHAIQYHLNWRLKTMELIEQQQDEELHYSLVMSLSKRDIQILKTKIVDLIEEVNQVLGPSKEEEAQVLCIDFFNLDKPI